MCGRTGISNTTCARLVWDRTRECYSRRMYVSVITYISGQLSLVVQKVPTSIRNVASCCSPFVTMCHMFGMLQHRLVTIPLSWSCDAVHFIAIYSHISLHMVEKNFHLAGLKSYDGICQFSGPNTSMWALRLGCTKPVTTTVILTAYEHSCRRGIATTGQFLVASGDNSLTSIRAITCFPR